MHSTLSVGEINKNKNRLMKICLKVTLLKPKSFSCINPRLCEDHSKSKEVLLRLIIKKKSENKMKTCAFYIFDR